MATATLAPEASSSPGKCAAIAVELNQVAAKTNDKRKSASLGGSASSEISLTLGTLLLLTVGRSAFNGSAKSRWIRAQPIQASRQPQVASIKPDKGQPTVLAKPATRVIPVIGRRASFPYMPAKVAKAAS